MIACVLHRSHRRVQKPNIHSSSVYTTHYTAINFTCRWKIYCCYLSILTKFFFLQIGFPKSRRCHIKCLQFRFGLQIRHHGIHIGNFKRVGLWVLHKWLFHEHFFNDPIVHYHTITPRPFAKATFRIPLTGHTHTTCKQGCTIRNQLDTRKTKTPHRHVLLQPTSWQKRCSGRVCLWV